MADRVIRDGDRWLLDGGGPFTELANRFLGHLGSRAFSPATVRGYAFDLLNFSRFLGERGIGLAGVVPSDLFDWLDWQSARPNRNSGKVVRLTTRGPAASTMNRRVAAVRGLFEYAVIVGARDVNPVPSGRRSSGLRAPKAGMLAHTAGGRERRGGRLVREPHRLPEAIDIDDVSVFLADLDSARDRTIVLLMVLGGLRAAEVRSLRLADIDMGLRRCSAKDAANESCRSIRRSSTNWRSISATNARPDARRRNASWCYVAQRQANR